MAPRPPAPAVKPPFTVTSVPAPAPVKPAASSAPAAPAKRAVSAEAIRKRAYEVWVAKGRPVGQDLQNWQQAERELLAKN
jgi:hypothetical protein